MSAQAPVLMTARKHSRCNKCEEPIKPGDRILWDAAVAQAEHEHCDPPDCDDEVEVLRWDGH